MAVADWPPSFSHCPGTIAEKYGPHTPGTKHGSAATAMWQLDVPPTKATRRRQSTGPSGVAPSTPSPPACASIAEVPTGMPGGSPSSLAAVSDSTPAVAPSGSTRRPIRWWPSSARSPRPIARK